MWREAEEGRLWFTLLGDYPLCWEIAAVCSRAIKSRCPSRQEYSSGADELMFVLYDGQVFAALTCLNCGRYDVLSVASKRALHADSCVSIVATPDMRRGTLVHLGGYHGDHACTRAVA